jgi:hypothetical protein
MTAYGQVHQTMMMIGEFSVLRERLPHDWQEFVDWHNFRYPQHPWTTNSLAAAVSLKWGLPLAEIRTNDHIVFISHPRMKEYEWRFNEFLVNVLHDAAQRERIREEILQKGAIQD